MIDLDFAVRWFQNNLDHVFFVYGLAFFVMGIVILAQPKRKSSLRLISIIWILAAFGIIHGLNEWCDMFVLTHPGTGIFKTLSWMFLIGSFACLFEFGRRLTGICANVRIHEFSGYVPPWLMPVVVATSVVVSYVDEIKSGGVVARYFLAFPGSVLTAVGFFYYRKEVDVFRHGGVNKYFLSAAASFLVYAFLGGIVVPKTDFFLSRLINTDAFLSLVHCPVQVFRALTAIISSVSIAGVLRIFYLEQQQRLQCSNDELSNTKEQLLQNVKSQDIINRILRVSLLPLSIEEQLDKILHLILSETWFSVQSKGSIYLSNEGQTSLTLKSHFNFSKDHEQECSAVEFGRCLCGLAASTKSVVFASNSSDLRHTIRYRAMQPHGHYCIPIVSNDKLLGVINIYVNAEHTRKEEEELFLLNIAATVAGIIIRKEADDKIRYSNLIQQVINTILELSLKPISLSEHLDKSLEIISTVPWLSIKETGCIFVTDGDSDILVMTAHRGVSPKLHKTCGRLPFGKCLCGLAAATGDTVFKSELDDRHDVRFEGMKNHGHYCIPIKSMQRVLGVINLYVDYGHGRNDLEESFLFYVANTLAGIILRKQGEDKERALLNELQIHRNHLERLVQIRTQEIDTARNETKMAYDHLKTIVDTISAPVVVIGMDYRVLMMNKAVKEFYFGDDDEVPDVLSCFELFHRNGEKSNEAFYEDYTIEKMCKSKTPFRVVHKHYRNDGQLRILEIHSAPLKDLDNECQAVVQVIRDITESKIRESQLEVMASYDTLTSILNRSSFNNHLANILYNAREYDRKVAVLYMDLDYFKMINDTCGHDAGDLVLQRVANRLSRSIRDRDIVARLGGDEFGIILVDAVDMAFVEAVCKRVIEAVQRPVITDKGTFTVGISIGVSIFPDDGNKDDVLIKRSDIAMYHAKKNGKNGFVFYTKSLEEA